MLQPSLEKTQNASIEGSSDTEEVLCESVDYNKIYDELMERFDKAIHRSQTIHAAEKVQRQTLYHYRRRNNALLDFLRSFDDSSYEILDESMSVDASRIEGLMLTDHNLQPVLKSILQIAKGESPNSIELGESYGINLAVDELIPELPEDELDAAELNPQDLEMWTRRNFSHLVTSKFKPADVRAKGVRDFVDSSANNNKRRKRKDA